VPHDDNTRDYLCTGSLVVVEKAQNSCAVTCRIIQLLGNGDALSASPSDQDFANEETFP